jgi:argininosuccinate synthase
MKKKVVLGFSGGLDTTFCVLWLRDNGFEPVCVCLDIGQSADLAEVNRSAKLLGVSNVRIIDGKENFANMFIAPALKANALYQGVYPLATALSRPYIAKILVDAAREEGTNYVAHGSTGKGNDQVRIEMGVRALLPDAEIVDPIRDNSLNRDYEIDFLLKRGIDLGYTRQKPYSIDQNIWGRSICAGILEDLHVPPPEAVFEWTKAPENCPNEPRTVAIEFESGLPVALDGVRTSFIDLINQLNTIGGEHGIGRIDHIEDRLVGLKSRELYEAPAAIILIKAHKLLESLTLSKSSLDFKQTVDEKYAEMIYLGNWFSLHHMDLLAYLQQNQSMVSGTIQLKLYKGNCTVMSRESANSLYKPNLITYGEKSEFDQRNGAAFSRMLGMESFVQASVQISSIGNKIERLIGPAP